MKKTKDAEDKDAFLNAMKGVKKLNYDKIQTSPPVVKKPIQKKDSENSTPLPFSDRDTLEPVSSEAIISFTRDGLPHKIIRNLRRGQYNVDATLDLHGQTIEEARTALSQFILRCQELGMRTVLIIHGKGRGNKTPILKNKLNHWLRQTDSVLAFYTATARAGGTGALYVLLRRKS